MLTGEVGDDEGGYLDDVSHRALCRVMYESRRLTNTVVLVRSCTLNSGLAAKAHIGSAERNKA